MLGVFVGGWDLDAAEAVCGEEVAVLEGLASLVDNSLVRQSERGGDARFSMLESIREYALETSTTGDDAHGVRRRHLQYFLALAEEAEPQLTGADQGAWMARLELEHPNLNAALDWAEHHEGVLGVRLAGALWRFWYSRGHLSEGQARLARAVAREDAPAEAHATALQGAGILADAQGDYVEARALLEQALALRRELGDPAGISASLNSLGLVTEELGDYPAAEALLREALDLRRKLGDAWGVAASLVNLGKLTFNRGDHDAARPLFEEGLSLFELLEDKARIAVALNNLGSVENARGDYRRALDLHEESLALWRELDDDWGVALSTYNLGNALRNLGDEATALANYTESLRMFRRLEDKRSVVDVLEKLAALAAHREPERAVRLWGASDRCREALGAPLPRYERDDYRRQVEAARARLGEGAFAAAWQEGRALELEQAVSLALSSGRVDDHRVGGVGGPLLE